MSKFNISRPDKILASGLKSLTQISRGLYSHEKTRAKGLAEITFIGEKKITEVQNQCYKYDEDSYELEPDFTDYASLASLDPNKTYWLNTHGLHDVQNIQQIADNTDLDRLTIRQILDTTLRPKVEEYEHYIFFSINSVLRRSESELIIENLSFVLSSNYVLSFQEQEGDHFDYIRNKIETGLGLIRKNDADYLLCQLLDAILDNYFETIESLNVDLEALEAELIRHPTQQTIIHIEGVKQVAEVIKKSLGPIKDSLRVIENSGTDFIRSKNKKYYTNLINTCQAATEEIGATLNTLESLTNIYFSSLSQKMNETMKVLSIVATIFIPLTFIAGIYGMNFENMPELRNPSGYFYTLGAMGVIFILMLGFFRWKRWL
jgi:magnesium transporter